jgi:hypothetical protein
MLYSGGALNRIDERKSLGDAKVEAAEIRQKIKQGDDELSRFCGDPRNVYDTFARMSKAQEWNYKRHELSRRLTLLDREIGWRSEETGWKPAPSTFSYGSEG